MNPHRGDDASDAQPLVSCAACSRHHRASEARCPFCDVALGQRLVVRRVAPVARLGRAALHAFGIGAISATAALAGCSHEGDGSMAPVYGAPPEFLPTPDAGPDVGPPGKPAPGKPH